MLWLFTPGPAFGAVLPAAGGQGSGITKSREGGRDQGAVDKAVPAPDEKGKDGEQVSPPEWVQEGWRMLKSGDNDEAFRIWKQGVSRLKPDHVLLFAGVYRHQSSAVRRLDALGEKHGGIIISAGFHGSPAFYVLAAPSADRIPESKQYFREKLGVAYPRGREAGFFQSEDKAQTAEAGKQKSEDKAPKPARGADALQPEAKNPKPETHSVQGTKGKGRTSVRHSAAGKPAHTLRKHAAMLPPREPDVPRLFSMARAAEAAGDRDSAMTLLARVLVKQPTLAAARLMYARLWIADGQYEEAILAVAPLLTKKNADWRPWFWNGTAELMLGHLDQAATSLDEALARDGRNAAPWVQRAMVEQQRGHHSAALQILAMAEASQPGLPAVQLNIAWSSEALGMHDRAIQAYKTFLRLSAGAGLYTPIRKKVIHHLTVLEEYPRGKTKSVNRP